MGQKPLFYAVPPAGGADSPPTIAFASELGALLPLEWIDTGMSASSLADYLLIGYIPAPRTIHTGISKLQPGHWLRFDAQGMATRQYFDAGGSRRVGADRRTGTASGVRNVSASDGQIASGRPGCADT